MDDFPSALGLPPEEVASVLEAAGLAPSVHNTQPWRFRVAPNVVELHMDPERRLPVADPTDRELRVACGAALFNLRVALQGRGIRPIVTILPDRDRPEVIAAVRNGGSKKATPEIERLLRAVPLRRTNRKPFSDVTVAAPEQHDLRRAAVEEGAWLHIVHDREQLAQLGAMAVEAHRTQMADPEFRAELARWTGVNGDRPDGVPAAAGGPLPAPQDTWVLRDFTRGLGAERVPGKDYEGEPLIAVLTPHLNGPAAEVQAGQALERVLLTATADGLAVSHLSQVIEVPGVRERARRLLGGTRPPLAVLRIGYGWPVPRTRRRRVWDLLVRETAPSMI